MSTYVQTEGSMFTIGGREVCDGKIRVAKENDQLVSDFLAWAMKAKVYPEYTVQSGLGMFVGFFDAKASERVRNWLEQRGIRRSL